MSISNLETKIEKSYIFLICILKHLQKYEF